MYTSLSFALNSEFQLPENGFNNSEVLLPYIKPIFVILARLNFLNQFYTKDSKKIYLILKRVSYILSDISVAATYLLQSTKFHWIFNLFLGRNQNFLLNLRTQWILQLVLCVLNLSDLFCGLKLVDNSRMDINWLVGNLKVMNQMSADLSWSQWSKFNYFMISWVVTHSNV